MIVTQRTVASFLTPDGFSQPSVAAVLREGSLVTEASRYAVHALTTRGTRRRTPYGSRPVRVGEPVLLVPGFLAGDSSLGPMSRTLRHAGFRTYRADIRANVGCTLAAAAQLEERLEEISQRRGSRVRIVGHSLGGMLARGVAARRPDLVSGIVTMGSPMLAPGAHHASLARSVDLLVRLNRAGLRNLMAEDCVAGHCAQESFDAGACGARRRRRLHRDLLAPRRHRRLARVRRPRGRRGRGALVPRRHGLRPRGDRRGRRLRCGRSACRSVVEVDRGEIA